MTTTTGDAVASPQTTTLEPLPDPAAGQRLPNGRFVPGHIGLSPGRPRGARTKAALAVETRLSEQVGALGDKLVALALEGNVAALKMCIERLAPRPSAQPGSVELPAVDTPEDVAQAQAEVIGALAAGDIEPGQAKSLAELLKARSNALSGQAFERRFAAYLEQMRRAHDED